MENGNLVALSRQMVLRRELDVIANNVANIGTTGFRADRLLFQEHLQPQARATAFPRADRDVRFVIDPRTATDSTPGSVQQTGAELDVAIQGTGFFAVQTARGERYTRAGSFQVNAGGELVTADGDRVLTESGPVAFTAADGRPAIGPDGTISTLQGIRGRLRVVRFADEQALRKEGATLYAAPAGAAAQPVQNARVLQGALERSNVTPVLEIGRMIEVTRAYQTVSQVVEKTAELRRTAIDKLAQLP